MAIRIAEGNRIGQYSPGVPEREANATPGSGEGEHNLLAHVHTTGERHVELTLFQLAPNARQLAPIVSERIIADGTLAPSQLGFDEFVDEIGTGENGARVRPRQHDDFRPRKQR